MVRCMSVIVGRTPAGSTETHYMARDSWRGGEVYHETLGEMVRYGMIMRCMSVITGCTPSGSRETH